MLKILIVGSALLLLTGCAGRLFYFPDARLYGTPEKAKLAYEEVTFESGDGTLLNGWFVPAVGEAKGTVVHFHGNAQNMSAHFFFVHWLPPEGFNVFVFDYRGYGKSAGHVSRQGVYEDGLAALRYVQSRPDVDPNRLLVFGQSLGGANALAAIAKNDIAGIRAVAIESTFYSYRSITREKIGEMPVLKWLKWPLSFMVISNRYSPGPVVDEIAPVPVLFIHGTDDRVIPYHHSEALYRAAGDPKSLWRVDGAHHTEAFTQYGLTYRPRLVAFFEKAVEGRGLKGR